MMTVEENVFDCFIPITEAKLLTVPLQFLFARLCLIRIKALCRYQRKIFILEPGFTISYMKIWLMKRLHMHMRVCNIIRDMCICQCHQLVCNKSKAL
jgi:hypothetical protein